MALDIVVTENGKVGKYDQQGSIAFEDDADYWYLQPMIKEIENRTGQLIDLYGEAKFGGDFLEQVEKIVLDHLDRLKQRREKQWEVHVGTQLHPTRKDLFKTLIKKDLEEKLHRFIAMLRQAKRTNEHVVCLGD